MRELLREGEPEELTLTQVPPPPVKPDPPDGVRLRTEGQRLRVLWQPPASWPFPEVFSLKYRLRYRRRGASHFRQVRLAGGRGPEGGGAQRDAG